MLCFIQGIYLNTYLLPLKCFLRSIWLPVTVIFYVYLLILSGVLKLQYENAIYY